MNLLLLISQRLTEVMSKSIRGVVQSHPYIYGIATILSIQYLISIIIIIQFVEADLCLSIYEAVGLPLNIQQTASFLQP